MSGTVTEVNEALNTAPEQVNKDAHAAWMIKVKLKDPAKRSSCCRPPITRSSSPKRAGTEGHWVLQYLAKRVRSHNAESDGADCESCAEALTNSGAALGRLYDEHLVDPKAVDGNCSYEELR